MPNMQTLETVEDREAWRAAVHGSQRVRHNLVTEQQQMINSKKTTARHILAKVMEE